MRLSGDKPHVRHLRAPAFAALALMLLSGCSSDASRLGDAFSNPFSRGVDATPTGSATASPAGPVAGVARAPLLTPQHNVSAAPTPSPAVRAAALPAPASTAGIASPRGGWVAEGGTPIVVAQGETAAMLATRYGVPEADMLRVNGFSTAAQVQPGTRLVIPAYGAGAGQVAARPAVAIAPVKSAAVAAKPAPVKTAVAAVPPAGIKKGKLAKAAIKPVAVVLPVAAPAKAAAPLAKARLEMPKTAAAGAPAPAKLAAAPLPAPAAPLKPEPVRTAAVAKPAALPQPAAPAAVDKTTTASLPPAAAMPAAATEGNPEFRWPARGRIIQGFQGGNDGINIAVPEGTSVKAAEGGVVAYAGSELKGYGNLVLIKHPNGFVSAYANNGSLEVKRGDQVKRGQIVAKSGQSGNVSSPQLHFELRKGSTPVDPTGYLAGL